MLIHDLLEPATEKTGAEGHGEGAERGGRGSPQILLGEEKKRCKSNAHEPMAAVTDSRNTQPHPASVKSLHLFHGDQKTIYDILF